MSDLEGKRNKELIEEREEYEKRFFSNIVEEMIESDALDRLIADRLQYIDSHFDFEPSPAYMELEKLYYAEREAEQRAIDDADRIDGIDYPDDPREVIRRERNQSFQYGDLVDYDYEIIDLEAEPYCPPEEFDDFQPDYPQEEYIDFDVDGVKELSQDELAKYYEQLVQDAVIEEYDDEKNLESLIQVHLEEEENFLENILIEAIEEDYLFEKAIDRLIFDGIELDYEPDMFDYPEKSYWYAGHYSQDDSAIDPFDSFGEIDYPEEPPSLEESWNRLEFERHVQEVQCMEATEEDYAKYVRSKELELKRQMPREEKHSFTDNDELRNQVLIEERERVESVFKDYFTKDDTLELIIQEKLRERKFNH